MLTLIRREIEDNIVSWALGALLALIMASIIITAVAGRNVHNVSPLSTSSSMVQTITGALPVYASALIVITTLIQGFVERSRKIPTFLATLAATRSRLFVARAIAGMLLVLLMVVPVAVTSNVVIRMSDVRAVGDVYIHLTNDIYCVVILLVAACFSVTLRFSLNRGVVWTVFASVLTWAALVSVIFIKGFSMQAGVFYAAVIAASLILTWRKFLEIPL